MSEPIPESIPTSQDPRSKRPTKRLALTPTGQQATQLEALFAKPDRDIVLPASDSTKQRGLAPPPEIVANVQGSSAGAGSGEFHVYKASRRREYERLKLMDEEVKREKENEEFEKSKEERKKKDEAKTNKNKARREKLKARKAGKKGKDGAEGGMDGVVATNGGGDVKAAKGEDVPEVAAVNGKVASETKVVEEEGVLIHDDD